MLLFSRARSGRLLLAAGLLASALWMAGCGGGGSSGPSTTPTPTPTPIAGNSILVTLADDRGLPVDGVVSLSMGINVYRLGTTGGQATFVGFAAGLYSLEAQVNGLAQMRQVTIGNGATTQNFVFPSSVTPTPTTTAPPPPFS